MNNKPIEEFRSFNRFYTAVIGLLDNHILNSNYTLVEARIMYELYHGKNQTASDLIHTLSIDKGYLSRVLRQFEKRKFINRQRSAEDTRVIFLNLTAEGKKEFQQLDKASNDQVKSILKELSEKDLALLLGSMAEIKRILTSK
ncbi:DNA-binding transcriptional regulator, MarR family [Chryseolinea serpens]|uniref:DNA-binding transcriptional regulator, MarR family n=1 Tax=Chryseolinea serpens TaxID=947013 RepID=A0A1M5WUY4_9BACT|nr:MarR family winged helix-turn-helix transcriptional regulator [Chryseolinea serpens]SHH91270.1 DNA-binding transcriptional regulator, MarR family [Chryseolinea serpens]